MENTSLETFANVVVGSCIHSGTNRTATRLSLSGCLLPVSVKLLLSCSLPTCCLKLSRSLLTQSCCAWLTRTTLT